MLNKNGYTSVLFEPGHDGVLNARKRNIKYIYNGIFNREIINDNTVPNIGLFDVLEHIDQDELFLNELNQLLANDGLLYITVPAYQFLFSEEDTRARHFRRYNYKDLKNKMVRANFTILFSSYFFWFLPLPVLLFRKLFKFNTKKSNGREKGHIFPNIIDKNLKFVLSFEIGMIKRKRIIPFGGSLLIVAGKNQ
ncbi:hypothetical protein FACS189496_3710 [Bacilli bacterium]|nr:hypothetical protein FACS189496_3710 [Bacilli bacterium]